MPFQFAEKPRSRQLTGEPPTATYQYTATGSSSQSFVYGYAVANTPVTVFTYEGLLYRQNISVDELGYRMFDVTISYAKRKNVTGEWRFTFDGAGASLHISKSKETVACFPDNAKKNAFGQLIGVDGDQIAGTDIIIPAMRVSIHFKHPAGVVDIFQAIAWGLKTGQTNLTPFFGRPQGEWLYLGPAGSDGSEAEAEVSHGFAFAPNLTNQTFGTITGVSFKGHEVVWSTSEDAEEDIGGDKFMVKKPRLIYVERVYDEFAFAPFFGFGG